MKKIAVPSENISNRSSKKPSFTGAYKAKLCLRSQLFLNQIFDKKRLKALISWVFKQSGEAEALRIIDLLKETGFRHATKAGISIGLHDLATPIQKAVLISESQLAIGTTERDFRGAKITATERSQRIIDTWHRASESLSKQVVDYFAIYDRFNPVYIMALSGARGNFSQVRQLIGMRGLMADQQGKIVNFPIQSNLREGLTLTEYFISCSGARKGLVDTALRTADTGYLTRRLVDVSHHVVVRKLRCNTNRSLAFSCLQSYNKVLLPLKERLVGRVLSEDIFISEDRSFFSRFYEAKSPFFLKEQSFNKGCKGLVTFSQAKDVAALSKRKTEIDDVPLQSAYVPLPPDYPYPPSGGKKGGNRGMGSRSFLGHAKQNLHIGRTAIAKQDQEISLKLALKIAKVREKVYLRSPLTCGFTHSVCQLCYGWSISQGSLVSLGDAVGVIAAQSIGEPGTQLTMRTFHTGGVFSGDLLQEIRAPHAGKIDFSKAFGGLLIRTTHGHLAFLSKSEGSFSITYEEPHKTNPRRTVISIPPFSLLFIRQGEKVTNNQLLAEFSIRTKEGAQPIKTQQTIFAELSGIIVEDCSGRVYTKKVKESALLLDSLDFQGSKKSKNRGLTLQSTYLDFPKVAYDAVSQNLPIINEDRYEQQLEKNGKRDFKELDFTNGVALVPAFAMIPFLPPFRGVLAFFPRRGSQRKWEALLPQRKHQFNKTKNLSKFWSSNKYKSTRAQTKLREPVQIEESPNKASPAHTNLLTKRSFVLVRARKKLCTPYVANPQRGVQSLDLLRLSSICNKRLGKEKKAPFFFLSTSEKEAQITVKSSGYKTKLCTTEVKPVGLSTCKAQIYTNEEIENDLFSYIEPVQSGRLGFLKILSTRIGATLDYSYPTKSIDPNLKKKYKIHNFRKDRYYTNLDFANSKLFHFDLSSNKASQIRFTNRKRVGFDGIQSFVLLGVSKSCKSTQMKNKDLTRKNKTLQFCLSKIESKYLHPESRKENRFLLQTIAEYGDILDETYKKKGNRV